ncbi:MAG: sulfotransferase [Cyanobacteria bacterium P01_H01_bin.15]
MTLPNFIIFGVQKSGTTSVYKYLSQHPQVYVSPTKETNFLCTDWERNPLTVVNKNSDRSERKKIRTFEDYTALFDGVTDEIAIGEASPNYLFHYETSVPQIKKYVPDVKLIAILRNPVDRAYSDYLMMVREGRETKAISEQLAGETISSFTIKKGLYFEALQHFYANFDSARIKIFLFDELRQDSTKLMQELYEFLNVDSTFVPDTERVFQKAQVPKNQALNKLLQTPNPLRSSFAGLLQGVLPVKTRQNLRKSLVNLNMGSKSKPKLSDSDRSQLFEIYRHDILKLQDLIQRDLSVWLNE